MISYAGIPLNVATDEVAAWVSINIPVESVVEFAPRLSPGPGLAGVPFAPPLPPGPVRVGRLHWPVGASRFAVGHYVVSTPRLDAIRNAVYPSATGYVAGDLVLDGGNGPKVTAPMWLLPPRPLAQVGDAPGMWLLTLVDERYFWWRKATSVAAQATWEDLYAAVGTALGVTITVDTIPAAYLAPPADLAGRYAALPVLLDGIAASVGQRIVRHFAGYVTAQNAGSARTSWLASRTTHAARVLAGGTVQV